MPKYSFIFHKDVYLRQVIEAEDYPSAELEALELDEEIGELYQGPFLLASWREIPTGEIESK